MVKINDAMQTGGAKFLFNLSGAVGRFGEDAVLKALRKGNIPSKKFTVTRTGQALEFDMKDMTFGDALQVQNKSGQGLDAAIPIIQPRPPAPHHVVLEVKSKMGPELPFLPLSDAQKGDNYIRRQIATVEAGIGTARDSIKKGRQAGRTWEDMIVHERAIAQLKESDRRGNITKIVAQVELDRSGNLFGDISWKDW